MREYVRRDSTLTFRASNQSRETSGDFGSRTQPCRKQRRNRTTPESWPSRPWAHYVRYVISQPTGNPTQIGDECYCGVVLRTPLNRLRSSRMPLCHCCPLSGLTQQHSLSPQTTVRLGSFPQFSKQDDIAQNASFGTTSSRTKVARFPLGLFLRITSSFRCWRPRKRF